MDAKDRKSSVREYVTSITGTALNFMTGTALNFMFAIGLALLIRTAVVQAFYIPSGSMEDTGYFDEWDIFSIWEDNYNKAVYSITGIDSP